MITSKCVYTRVCTMYIKIKRRKKKGVPKSFHPLCRYRCEFWLKTTQTRGTREKGGEVKGWLGKIFERENIWSAFSGAPYLNGVSMSTRSRGRGPTLFIPPSHFIFVRRKKKEVEGREKESLPFSPKCFYASKCLLKF